MSAIFLYVLLASNTTLEFLPMPQPFPDFTSINDNPDPGCYCMPSSNKEDKPDPDNVFMLQSNNVRRRLSKTITFSKCFLFLLMIIFVCLIPCSQPPLSDAISQTCFFKNNVSYVDISRLKSCSGNNLGDGPNLGFSYETSVGISPVVVTSIYNEEILPIRTSVAIDDTPFQVGSILCFINNKNILTMASNKAVEYISHANVVNLAYCNSLNTYDELKSNSCFDCNVGFCASPEVGGSLKVTWIYNRTLFPVIEPEMIQHFEVGSIITHVNNNNVIGMGFTELQILIDTEGFNSLKFVATETACIALLPERHLKRKHGKFGKLSPSEIILAVQQRRRDVETLKMQEQHDNDNAVRRNNLTPEKRFAINAIRKNNLTPEKRDAQNAVRRNNLTPEKRDTNNAARNERNRAKKIAADLAILEAARRVATDFANEAVEAVEAAADFANEALDAVEAAAEPDEVPHHVNRHVARTCTIDNFKSNIMFYGVDIGPLGNNGVNCCKYCGARYWIGELNTRKQFNRCCSQNRIRLPQITPPSALMTELFVGDTPASKAFLKRARAFNSKLAFASVKCEKDKRFSETHGVPNFRISGNIYHQIGAYNAPPDRAPSFLQCYFYDGALTNTFFDFSTIENNIEKQIYDEIRAKNPFIRSFKTNIHLIETAPNFNIIISDRVPSGQHDRVFNTPVVTELAAILLGDEHAGITSKSRDIVLRKQGAGLDFVPSHHSSYDPLAYVLYHMEAERGWNYDLKTYKDSSADSLLSTKNLSTMDFYTYRNQLRDPKWDKDEPSTWNINQDVLSFGGLLSDQYWVDQWVKIEEQRLKFITHNQQKLKQEIYSGLADAVRANEARDAGSYVVLPSSHIGSPRHMSMNFQDAMAIVRKKSKPDLFITFTCNPNWQEILDEIRPNEQAWMRKDITVRVFQLKLKCLLDDLLKHNVLGKAVAHMHVIEFQKRGLPHAHILIILAAEDKPRNVDDIDHIVCAEVPHPILQKELYDIVGANMLHGPCGELNPKCVCMEDGMCTKRFPKTCHSETYMDEDSYPEYRRRQRHTFQKPNKPPMGDEWVVPYNPYLSLKYKAHINVEICNSLMSVKYLYKYVFKGHDKLSVTLVTDDSLTHLQLRTPEEERERANNAVRIDEVKQFVESRYVSCCEAMWRLNGFHMSGIDPNVIRLQIHLPDQQMLTYLAGEEQLALAAAQVKLTTLTGYFSAVRNEHLAPLSSFALDNHGVVLPRASGLTYTDFPTYYAWRADKNDWIRRSKPKKSDAVSRIYNIHPDAGEKYYLRLLLLNVQGATSFEALKTVDAIVHPTFLEACKAMGLLADDAEWKRCLEEACYYQSAQALRTLFVVILLNNSPTNVPELFDLAFENTTLQNEMSDDFFYQRKILAGNMNLRRDETDIYECLLELDSSLKELSNGTKDLEFFNLPSVPMDYIRRGGASDNSLLRQEMLYDVEQQHAFWTENVSKLNDEQKPVFETITSQVESGTPSISNVYFIDAPGGTGKTFLFNTLLAKFRSQRKICLALASSGIASILLAGGRTAHSRFKIPLSVDEATSLRINKRTMLGKLLIAAEIIIWDEAPMTSKNILSSVDRLLRNLMGHTDQYNQFHPHPKPFGGKIFIFGGDFRQNTPVLPKQNRAGICMQLISRCSWWSNINKFKLTINERIRRVASSNEDLDSFSDFLSNVGNGAIPIHRDLGDFMIRIPDEYVFQSKKIEDFIDWCFPNIAQNPDVGDKAILTPLNKDCHELNSMALRKMAGDVSLHRSVDSIDGDEAGEALNYPVEFLNTLDLSGMPVHNLELKIGCPLILLRNLNPLAGLCNGTRLKLLDFTPRLLTVEILNGSHKGQRSYIPRLDLINADNVLPFKMKRRQFPVRLGFALTINKAQGQTLSQTGIYLPNPVFSHGQLYVALSRSASKAKTKIFISDVKGRQGTFPDKPGVYTKNVVYAEALSDS